MADAPPPGDPLYWPEAPAQATFHDGEGWLGTQGRGWAVSEVPPGGFPFIDPPFSRALYGPPGTFWIFDVSDMLAALAGLPDGGPPKYLINRALKKLGMAVGGGSVLFFRVPSPDPTVQIGTPMRWIRTTVTGKVGIDEQVAHVLNWCEGSPGALPNDPQSVTAFGAKLRDQWLAFLGSGGIAGAGGTLTALLASQLEYTEVRAALLEQTAPGQRPTYVVPTQYVPFVPGTAKGTAQYGPLPYEVAMVMSLNTNFRGPRFRGRTYLGPLAAAVMGSDGQFSRGATHAFGSAFGTAVVGAMNATSACDLHVVSLKYATSAPVQGVRVGLTPDSQRSRRRGRAEDYVQEWGTPIGGA